MDWKAKRRTDREANGGILSSTLLSSLGETGGACAQGHLPQPGQEARTTT